MNRDIKVALGLTFLFVVILCSSLFFAVRQFDRPYEPIPFTVEGWNAPMTDSNGLFTGIRLKMVDDLLQQYDFHGWSLQQVQNLLGEPMPTHKTEEKHLIYYDLRDGLNLLVFELDSQQRVVDYLR